MELEKEKEWERYNYKGDSAIPYNKTEIAALFSRYKDACRYYFIFVANYPGVQ